MQNPQNLIWIDLEMTGLNPDTDVIIEMATIVTDSNLNTLLKDRSSLSIRATRFSPAWTSGTLASTVVPA